MSSRHLTKVLEENECHTRDEFYFDLVDTAENESESEASTVPLVPSASSEPCLFPASVTSSGLHPGTATGMRRVSSCYFSISEASGSCADLMQLLEFEGEGMNHSETNQQKCLSSSNENPSKDDPTKWSAVVVLYHDIMMNVFTFLPPSSLTAFSETSRRANFEVFYFLQLQLRRALIPRQTLDSSEKTMRGGDVLSEIKGVRILRRYAELDHQGAERVVQDYVDSNSTLKNMPLSHSLVYLRHVLMQHGFYPSSARSAAILMTVMGLGIMGSGAAGKDYFEALSYGIFRMGLAGGLMKAAADARQSKSATNTHNINGGRGMMHSAEQLARMVQDHLKMPHLPTQHLTNLVSPSPENGIYKPENHDSKHISTLFPSAIAARLYWAFNSANEEMLDKSGSEIKRSMEQEYKLEDDCAAGTNNFSDIEDKVIDAMEHPITPNPYDHPISLNESNDTTPSPDSTTNQNHKNSCSGAIPRTKPSACMAAFAKAMCTTRRKVQRLIKECRKSNFLALSENERIQISTSFIDACSQDDNLPLVKSMLHKRMAMDVDGFFIGSDGTETCALHTAAFHGAHRILEFLCAGLDEENFEDGGMCDVNIRDDNGWTALHFAAGANSVEAVKVLSKYGAKLALEAGNGYTPYHWAERLSNQDVAVELRNLGADQRFLDVGWMSTSFFQIPFMGLVSPD